MTSETKKRITDINNGIIPEGYKKTKVGIVPVEWEIVKLSDIMHNEQRPVEKPKEPYLRIGIRSHAKGTFQELVEKPEEVNMDTLYVVKKDDFIVNITFAWEHAIALASDNDDGKLVSHRFPTYVFDNNSPVYYKYVFCQDLFRQRLELISPGGAGRNRVLNKTDFLNLEIFHPPLPEQQKIAEILSTQDKLIELQERKINQLKTLKKGYLQKMFPKKGCKYPELRFKGFTDPWEQRELGEIYSFQYGEFNNNPDNGGVYPIYGANGIIGGYTEYNAEDSAVIGHMGAYAGYVVWAEGKHFVTYNGTIAKPSDNTTDSKYGFYLLSSKQIYRICAGSGQPFVSYNDLNNIDVVIPKAKEEQRKIGNYCSHLDSLITLNQRKLDEEKQKKKALMQLLLTGKVRVKL